MSNNNFISTTTKFLIIMTTITSSIQAQPAVITDEQQIRANIHTLEEGWNHKSGKEFASAFAPTLDFIPWNGLYFPNMSREQCAGAHDGLFHAHYSNTDIHLVVDKVKFLSADISLSHVFGAAYDHGTAVPKDPGLLMTIIQQKVDGKWQIISFHNLDLETITDPEQAKGSPMPLSVMYAGWYNRQ